MGYGLAWARLKLEIMSEILIHKGLGIITLFPKILKIIH